MTRTCLAAMVALSVLAPCAARADTRSDVLIAIGRCERFTDDRAWLDCLDAAEAPMRAKLGSPAPAAPPPRSAPAPAPAPAPAAGPAEASRRFGLPIPRLPSRPPSEAGVRAGMTSFSFDRFGMFTVTLQNGQVWRQIPADTNVAHWSKPAAAYIVNIRNGAFGSFNLSVQGEGASYKVMRIK